MLAERVMEEAKQIWEAVRADRRFLHENPGSGFDVSVAKDYVREKLIEIGLTPKDCGKCGLIALVGGKKSQRTFLLRADMDGLSINEEAKIPFAATNGKMHACGHDMHTAMLLGAARILKAHEEEINGTVKLMFQPAEEIFEGAKDMIEAGLLENPKVDAALMIHVMAQMPFAAGTVIVSSPGVSAPAADYFEIHVRGKGCHGSMPNTGIDPLTAAAHILLALDEIRTRELPMGERAVLTVGTMHAGNAANVIPDSVVMGGSIRTFQEETRAYIKERMIGISQHIAQAYRAEAKVAFTSGCPTLINDESLSSLAYTFSKELLGEQKTFSVEKLMGMKGDGTKSAGSEDFAYVSQKLPSVMIALAAGEPEKGYCYPQHHPMVQFDEEALVNGCAIYAYLAMRYLES